MKNENSFNSKQAVLALLAKPATKQEAEELKNKFGVLKGQATKGDVLLASMFNLAVEKGNLSAAKEIIAIADSGDSAETPLLQQMISDMKEE